MDPIVKDLERALQLEKEDKKAEAVHAAKEFLARHPQHPSSIDAALLWVRLETTDPLALFWLGNAYMYQGRFAEASAAFTFCTRTDPTNAEAFSALSICIRNTGDLSKSMDASKKALELKHDDLRAHLNYMDVLFDMGYFEDCLQYGLEILPLFPNNTGVQTNIARSYAALDQIDKAIEYHKKTIQLEPYQPIFRVNYLGALFKKHDQAEIHKQIKIVYGLFKEKELYQRILPVEWTKIKYQHALVENELVDPEHDKILKMVDMDHIGVEHTGFEIVDKSNPVWLIKLNDITCFSTDWAYSNHDSVFMNSKVTGRWFNYLLTCGIHGNAYLTEKDYPVRVIDEPGIVMGGSDNYYHWIVDYLPRFSALEYYPEFKDAPIFVNGLFKPFQMQALQHLGIDPSRLRHLPTDNIIKFKNAHLAYIPGRPMMPTGEPDWMKPNENPFIPQWLRKTFLKDIPLERKKRYFLSRKNAEFRRVLNEDEIYQIAREYGFEKLENQGKDFLDQVRLYAMADAVIGPHGAGFTNLMFSPPDATLIEFIPRGRKLPFYSELTQELGQSYDTVEGPILKIFMDRSSDFGDFYLDPAHFREIMDKHFSA